MKFVVADSLTNNLDVDIEIDFEIDSESKEKIMDRYHLERMTLCEKDDADCPDELWHVPLYKVVTQAGRVVEDLLTHSQGLLAIDDLEFNDWVDEEDLAWD